jgi:hypothetical protein
MLLGIHKLLVSVRRMEEAQLLIRNVHSIFLCHVYGVNLKLNSYYHLKDYDI